jgi:hypothetical protein
MARASALAVFNHALEPDRLHHWQVGQLLALEMRPVQTPA